MEQLRLVRQDGFKSKHDDCLDTISQLPLLNAWRPGQEVSKTAEGLPYDEDVEDDDTDRIGSYVV